MRDLRADPTALEFELPTASAASSKLESSVESRDREAFVEGPGHTRVDPQIGVAPRLS